MQTFHKHKIGSMKLEEFQRLIERNAGYLNRHNIKVEPYFRGEPLIHPQFFEMMDILKEYQIQKAGINTNLSVNIDIDKFLNHPMLIIVTLGGTTKEVHERVMIGSDFSLVIKNLKKLYELEIPANVKMNPTRVNIHQLPGLPDFIQSLGGKKEYVIPYTITYPLPITATIEEIDYFFRNVVSREMDPYLRFTYDLSKPDKSIKAKNPGCYHLQDVIFFDGQFSICCHDQLQTINLGNAFQSTIEEIKESKAYATAIKTAKARGFKICKECN